MRKKCEVSTINHTQQAKREKQIKRLEKRHQQLGKWIEEHITHPNWEQKVRDYNNLSSQIIAMKGTLKYIIIHHQN